MVSPGLQESTLAAFNAAPPEAAERDLLTCCASESFARAIAEGRPYPEPPPSEPRWTPFSAC